ncbi:T4 RnlA family RNA ligase [Candidatus Dojkabacteria bacterium]|jgi:RNA ligase|nr:T4 RnlA family RNA ligase [Candidatus Dojkabacteria bacterium]
MKLTKEQLKLIELMINDGYINCQKHPNVDLWIYNYSNKTQFDKMWNEATIMCRGLILDGDNNIVALPFKKFFNYGEDINLKIPNEEPIISEKIDGSLGILYWIKDTPYIATRGSFISEQAVWATKWLHKYLENGGECMNKNATMLFEIIYPENRIVVDYNGYEGLIHLAQIDLNTGKQIINPYIPKGIKSAKIVKNQDLETLKNIKIDNQEGFVIFYPKSELRLKVKFEEYVRLHRLITGVNERRIWDILRNNQDINELLDRVPDEFYNWVKKIIDDLKHTYARIHKEAIAVSLSVQNLDTRKEQAEIIKKYKYPSVVFSLLDGKNPNQIIWKLLKPKSNKPFKIEI